MVNTGTKKRLRIEEKAKPPITERASGLHVSAPEPNSSANGIIEQIVVNAVRIMGRILRCDARTNR